MTVAIGFATALVLIGFALSRDVERGRAPRQPVNSVAPLSVKTIRVRSLAILPFQPFVGDAPDESVEAEMTRALNERLSRIRQLAIRSPDSVWKYAGAGQDPLVAGRELHVDALLVGRVQRTGDRIRLSVRQVDALDGATMWSETFDERWAEIVAIQDSISDQVARAAAVRLTGAQREQLAKRDTDNPAAYREYLIGRHFWGQRTGAGLKQGLQHFEKAIEPSCSTRATRLLI